MRSFIRQALMLLLIAAIPALVSAYIHRDLFDEPPLASDETTWGQVAAWQRAAKAGEDAPRILLVDARSDSSYREGHAPGALPLNEAHWNQQLPAIIEALGRAPETRIIVYCDDMLCDASRAVAARLQRDLGHADVFVLKGGWHSR